jgi:hypothetical protein
VLPESGNALVIRTDFSDEAAWDRLCGAIRTPSPDFGFLANVDFVSDRQYDGATADALVAEAPDSQQLLFVADRVALTHPEQPLLAVYYFDKPFRSLRVIPSELWGVENNISLANMDFDEFAENVGPDGIFRGF